MHGWRSFCALAVVSVLVAAGCGGPAGDRGTSAARPSAAERPAESSAGSSARESSTERPVTGQSTAGQYEPEVLVSERCLREAARRGEAGVVLRRPPEVPAYEVTGATATGDGLRLRVVTPTTERADLRLIAEELRARNREHDALSVNFYRDTTERRDVGTAYVFNTREAACRVFGYSAEQQENILREGNGIVVVSTEEGT